MEVHRAPFEKISQLSDKDIAYATEAPALRRFFKYRAHIDSFAKVMDDKKKDLTDRSALVETLREQYQKYETSGRVKENIESLLHGHTFTITTAHQPCLFTGPLYYIYKIISTINLAENLQARYPDRRFVPVFISGGEDHDFEEVNHTYLFGKRLQWDSEESGSVGMMKTQSLKPVLNQLKEILGDSERAQTVFNLIEDAYTSHATYSEATIHLINNLFSEYGLVVLDMSHPRLKRIFAPYIRKEIIEQPSKELVEAATFQLEAAGYSGQAYPREINFFYLGDQYRERIVFEEGLYRVLNTSLEFTETELLKEIESHPERFSPNVVMRPLYQELILPNLAYVGGGGEIAYWLERQSQFEYFGLNFPMLVRRNSVLWIDRGSSKRMDALGITVETLFEDSEELIKQYIRKNAETELTFSEEKKQLEALFVSAGEKAKEVDPTLFTAISAEATRQMKSLEQLETRLMRAEKKRHEVAVNQIRALKEKLFPGNGLQERYDNFLGFYFAYGKDFLGTLKEHLDPLEPGFIVIRDSATP
jgi:bacillithiol synthase